MSHAFDRALALVEAPPLRPAAAAADTALTDEKRVFAGQVVPDFNIGANPNGGYLLALAAAAVQRAVPGHPDPLSITVHYLRPGLAGQPCRIETEVLRRGRSFSTVRAVLHQEGGARLALMAAMGDLGADAKASDTALPMWTLPPPDLPPPEACPVRSGEAQGVDLTILGALDTRLHPDQARPGQAGSAEVSGWIRFRDGREPDALASLLFVDAFPPSAFGLLGMVGWVPTVEMTVHLRRRPAPGWICGHFRTADLLDGRAIEDAALWDSQGRLVARARQLALVRSPR